MQDQILYHSFPRRRDDARALKVLDSILELGLLVTPEILDWKFSDGVPFQTAQKRICFTALEQEKLPEHAQLFGDISLGFLRSDLERAGAVPVFYVPRSLDHKKQGRNIGSFHMERLYQMLFILQQLRASDASFFFREKKLNLEDMEGFTRYLTGLFYPLEDIEEGKNRFYFAQKEWRIMSTLIFRGKPLCRRLKAEEAARIEAFDIKFFRQKLNFPTGSYSLIEQSLLLPKILNMPVRNRIVQIVAPKRLKTLISQLLKKWHVSPEVILLDGKS